jgi:hypothetical protein
MIKEEEFSVISYRPTGIIHEYPYRDEVSYVLKLRIMNFNIRQTLIEMSLYRIFHTDMSCDSRKRIGADLGGEYVAGEGAGHVAGGRVECDHVESSIGRGSYAHAHLRARAPHQLREAARGAHHAIRRVVVAVAGVVQHFTELVALFK